MASGATPCMGKDERHPVSGKIILFVEDRALNIAGELKDASQAGFRIAHTCALLKPGAVARIFFNDLEKRVRIVWVRDLGNRIETGLLHHETYLVKCALAGDGPAFTELVSPYLHVLRRTVNSILSNRADADEAVQEALLKVALHLDQFHSGSDFKPWLYRIATREAFKRLRWNRRHINDLFPVQAEEDKDRALVERIADPGSSPAEILERKELASAISTALKSLNQIYRQIFIACDMQQLPVTEAARLLGLNIDTANTRLHRARLLMRKQLQGLHPSMSNGR
ncbi:MAG TPA: RNA polymerase sigma factor [Candidatus Angelobacter sp.]